MTQGGLCRYPTSEQKGLLWAWPVAGAWMESLEQQPFQFQDDTGWVGPPEYDFGVCPVTHAAMVENSLGELDPACEEPSVSRLTWYGASGIAFGP